ncbi:MAG: hypothetical protein HC767_03580 [Akkermansiaceae bacterium]|nr:hypothetical protein [Akkermansiaceae bacterium]
MKQKDFESEKSIYRKSPIGKLLPMLAGLVEDGEISDSDGHPLPPCIIMERGESLNEWCQRRKPDIWGVMPVCVGSGLVRLLGCTDHVRAATVIMPLRHVLHSIWLWRGLHGCSTSYVVRTHCSKSCVSGG